MLMHFIFGTFLCAVFFSRMHDFSPEQFFFFRFVCRQPNPNDPNRTNDNELISAATLTQYTTNLIYRRINDELKRKNVYYRKI